MWGAAEGGALGLGKGLGLGLGLGGFGDLPFGAPSSGEGVEGVSPHYPVQILQCLKNVVNGCSCGYSSGVPLSAVNVTARITGESKELSYEAVAKGEN